MGFSSQTQNTNSISSHLYPQALQLKLYQAFIFSVPVLFSVILFLLFYLFYLKRKRNSQLISSQLPTTLPITTNFNQPIPPLSSLVDLKEELKEKLHIIMFDEDLKAKESQCCVCLGEFEIKEELHQVPECKHVFHIECIHHWLRANTTCPLCRCSIVIPATTKLRTSSESATVQLTSISPSDSSFDEQQRLENSEHIVISTVVNGET